MEYSNRITLKADETAEYLGVSIDLIYKLVREKRIPYAKMGRRILFKKEAIDKWLDIQMEEAVE